MNAKNIICWFEIYVKNIEQARAFYSAVLDTPIAGTIEIPGTDSTPALKMATFPNTRNEDIVSGALIEMPGTKEGDAQCVNTMVYFPCADCSVYEERVINAGGKVMRSKFPVDAPGYISICVDTEGNPFGLFSLK